MTSHYPQYNQQYSHPLNTASHSYPHTHLNHQHATTHIPTSSSSLMTFQSPHRYNNSSNVYSLQTPSTGPGDHHNANYRYTPSSSSTHHHNHNTTTAYA